MRGAEVLPLVVARRGGPDVIAGKVRREALPGAPFDAVGDCGQRRDFCCEDAAASCGRLPRHGLPTEHSKASVEKASPPPVQLFILSTLLPLSSTMVAVCGVLPDCPRHLLRPPSKSSEKRVSLVSTEAGWHSRWKAENSAWFGSLRIRLWHRV